jgi:hypothetical protein
MSVNIVSGSTNPPPEGLQVFDNYDMDLLVGLMERHTIQLREKIEKRENRRAADSIIFTISSLIVTLSAIFIPERVLQLPEIWKWMAGFFLVSATAGFGSWVAFVQRNLANQNHEIRRLAFILAKLLRRTSQLLDRGGLAFSRRVVLEALISDAESILARTEPSRKQVTTTDA